MVLPGFPQRPLGFSATAALGLILILAGCGKKPDLKSEAADLEKAFPAATAQTPSPAAEAAQPGMVAGGPGADANAYVQQALVAVRNNDYARGVISLQHVAQTRGVTAGQLQAVEQMKQAIVGDLVGRAARGDASAKAALATIEKSRSQ
jgi:hypothetical protein